MPEVPGSSLQCHWRWRWWWWSAVRWLALAVTGCVSAGSTLQADSHGCSTAALYPLLYPLLLLLLLLCAVQMVEESLVLLLLLLFVSPSSLCCWWVAHLWRLMQQCCLQALHSPCWWWWWWCCCCLPVRAMLRHVLVGGLRPPKCAPPCRCPNCMMQSCCELGGTRFRSQLRCGLQASAPAPAFAGRRCTPSRPLTRTQ